MSSRALANQMVQVSTEAKARPTITVFTTMSAAMNMPHGERSRGSVTRASGTGTAGVAFGIGTAGAAAFGAGATADGAVKPGAASAGAAGAAAGEGVAGVWAKTGLRSRPKASNPAQRRRRPPEKEFIVLLICATLSYRYSSCICGGAPDPHAVRGSRLWN